jgi:hypothetical protein
MLTLQHLEFALPTWPAYDLCAPVMIASATVADLIRRERKKAARRNTDDGSGQERGFFLVRRHAISQGTRDCCHDNAFVAAIVLKGAYHACDQACERTFVLILSALFMPLISATKAT